jgi:hypothetical protein
MPMEKLIVAVTELIEEHWIKFLTGLLVMSFGWFAGNWRARKKWARKEFLDRLNVSLNSITDGTLRIRTILEKTSLDVFLNSVAAAQITEASQQTTPTDPTLPLARDDYWYFLNSVLNEIAEKFAEGVVRRDMGLESKSIPYLICLTNECAGEVRTRKVRAMLVQKSLLENLPEECPKLESANHATRWKTLQFLAIERTRNPWKFLEMEIAL